MVKFLRGTSLRSPTITPIKMAITSVIAPSQKTSYNLGNFYISDYWLRDLRAYILYLVLNKVLRIPKCSKLI